MVIKIKKTKKSKKLRGTTTHGHGARKKGKKSGTKGGLGMAGRVTRADQKKRGVYNYWLVGMLGYELPTSPSEVHILLFTNLLKLFRGNLQTTKFSIRYRFRTLKKTLSQLIDF